MCTGIPTVVTSGTIIDAPLGTGMTERTRVSTGVPQSIYPTMTPGGYGHYKSVVIRVYTTLLHVPVGMVKVIMNGARVTNNMYGYIDMVIMYMVL